MRENLRKYEDAHIDIMNFYIQVHDRKHEHIMETLELFAKEVMPEFQERHHAAPEVARAAAGRRKARDKRVDLARSSAERRVQSQRYEMPSPADIADPTFREALQKVESLIDDGDFTGASKQAARPIS